MKKEKIEKTSKKKKKEEVLKKQTIYPQGNMSDELFSIYRTLNIVKINTDGSIEVLGDVDISSLGLKEIPFNFRKVTGHFDCSNNFLIDLKNSPQRIIGSIDCSNNNISSLKGSPEKIEGHLDCSYNMLVNFMDGPQRVLNSVFAEGNPLESFEGIKSIGDDLIVDNSLEFEIKDVRRSCKIGGDFLKIKSKKIKISKI